MTLGMIWAEDRQGTIGGAQGMLWHVPADFAYFKETTMGHPVIMGRRTWDSIPPRFRPLPGRRNIVVTRQAHWQETGVESAPSLVDALQKCENDRQVWIIGGAQIYAQALPLADELVVTEIDAAFDGDAHAPAIGPDWREVARERIVAASGLPLSFVIWHRLQRPTLSRPPEYQ